MCDSASAHAGRKEGQVRYCATVVHNNAAKATGCGTGAIALIMADELKKPGVWAVQALPTDLFEQIASRGLTIHQE